jgi:hypothetical protein
MGGQGKQGAYISKGKNTATNPPGTAGRTEQLLTEGTRRSKHNLHKPHGFDESNHTLPRPHTQECTQSKRDKRSGRKPSTERTVPCRRRRSAEEGGVGEWSERRRGGQTRARTFLIEVIVLLHDERLRHGRGLLTERGARRRVPEPVAPGRGGSGGRHETFWRAVAVLDSEE